MATDLHPSSHARAGGLLPPQFIPDTVDAPLSPDLLGGVRPTQHDSADSADFIPPLCTSQSPSLTEDIMPSHWQSPKSPITHVAFAILCLVAVGQPDLQGMWESVHSDPLYERIRGQIAERIVTVVVVVSHYFDVDV